MKAVARALPDLRNTAWRETLAPPPFAVEPLTRGELDRLFRGGEGVVDRCEAALACAARSEGAIDVALAEGLDALRRGDRLARLGCHLDDYAREVLDLARRAAQGLARLGRELRTRPFLREALRSGEVSLRAAQTVLPVAHGEDEADWVERAATSTVRELEAAVRRVRSGLPPDDEEDWVALRTHLPPDERLVVDRAVELAGELVPGATPAERLEALAQEYLGAFSKDPDGDETRPLGGAFRVRGPGRARRCAELEAEMERWASLEDVAPALAPELTFDDAMSAEEIDRLLRELARMRAGWQDVIGYCAHALKASQVHVRLGFADFRQYVEERLGLPPRAVEQRVALEERRWASPALQEARKQGVSYERLRILSRLPERDIRSWTARALGLTCIALRRAVEGERERQMRARRKIAVSLPRRVAVLLAAAIETVRKQVDGGVNHGTALAIVGAHFIETWEEHVKTPSTRSQRVRDRDEGLCQVPGCSRRAGHAHHVVPRSRGGSDDPTNLVALCPFHHLRCVHGGYLNVVGRAPHGLQWFLDGVPWAGPTPAERPPGAAAG